MNKRSVLFSALLVIGILFFCGIEKTAASTGTINATYKYAWGENFGWINFAPTDSSDNYYGLTITDSAVTGYAWSKTYGWINFSPSTSGVTNNCSGELGGYAWSTERGWISMSGVTINSSGEFTGVAGTAGTDAGRISFDCDHCDVRTTWTHCSAAVCGNGVVESGEACDSGSSTNGVCPSTCSSSCTVNSCGNTPTCANGASDYPTCTPPPEPTCANGASDYPTCTPPPDPTCANGASDYPTCTPPPEPTCANGASDYPTCTPPPDNPPDEPPPDNPPDNPPDEPPPDNPPDNTTQGTGGSENGSNGSTGGSSGGIVESIQNVGSVITNSVSDFFSETVQTISEIPAVQIAQQAVDIVLERTKEIVDNPTVEKTNQTIAKPVIATVAVTNVVAAGVQFSQLLVYLQAIFSQPLLLLRRRKQKEWGVVYNSYTKQPLDLAAVRLINSETGRVMGTQVTDGQGRYFISSEPGTYKIEVQKTGFTAGSEYLKGFKEDRTYVNLYHGEDFKVQDEKKEINYSIPLDPELEKKTTKAILGEYTRLGLQRSISVIGAVATIISFIISPSTIIALLFCVHLFVYFFMSRISLKKVGRTTGSITDGQSHKPVGKAVVRVFDSAYHKLVAMAVTDRKGRYAILVGPSLYYITVEKTGYELYESGILDFSSEKTGGIGGLITEKVVLKPGQSAPPTPPSPVLKIEEKSPTPPQAPVDSSQSGGGTEDHIFSKMNEE